MSRALFVIQSQSYHKGGFVKGPVESVRVGGNRELARCLLLIFGMKEVATCFSSHVMLELLCGLITMTRFEKF